MENGGNCFIKTLVVQFMTFGPFYIFYGSLQTCILAHLLNSQCNKNNDSLLSFLATKICWKMKFKTKLWSKICKKWVIFNPETVLESWYQHVFRNEPKSTCFGFILTKRCVREICLFLSLIENVSINERDRMISQVTSFPCQLQNQE